MLHCGLNVKQNQCIEITHQGTLILKVQYFISIFPFLFYDIALSIYHILPVNIHFLFTNWDHKMSTSKTPHSNSEHRSMWLHYRSYYFKLTKLIARQMDFALLLSKFSFIAFTKCPSYVILTQLIWHIYNITPLGLSQTFSQLPLRLHFFVCFVFHVCFCFSHSYCTSQEQNRVPREFEQCRFGLSEWP